METLMMISYLVLSFTTLFVVLVGCVKLIEKVHPRQ